MYLKDMWLVSMVEGEGGVYLCLEECHLQSHWGVSCQVLILLQVPGTLEAVLCLPNEESCLYSWAPGAIIT